MENNLQKEFYTKKTLAFGEITAKVNVSRTSIAVQNQLQSKRYKYNSAFLFKNQL